MAENLVLEWKQSVSDPAEPRTLPLAEALELVRRDSRQDAEAYLDETVVPYGGE